MAKIQLTISPNYVPSWGVYETCREAVQNALDARDAGYPMTISHNGDALTIQNDGVILDRSIWLIGSTSKAGTDARGHYGEGLKLGALAAVRLSRKLRIVNGDEIWTCSLEDSSVFPGQQVLTVSTRKSSSKVAQLFRGVAVQIECSADEWEEFRDSFLDLKDPTDVIHTDYGTILRGAAEAGNIYVGGIKVEHNDKLICGYNFSPKHVITDRDRRMVDRHTRDYYSGLSWVYALKQDDISVDAFLALLMTDCPDAEAIAERRYSCDDTLIESVADVWRSIYGEKAVPVESTAEADRAGHLGRIGRITTKALCQFFRDTDLSLDHLEQQGRGDVVRTYSLDELYPPERDNLQLAMSLVDRVACSVGIGKTAGRTTVVDFRNEDILGTHSCDNESGDFVIRVARRSLLTPPKAIRVLVHEAAHDHGSDGSVSHERAEGQLFSAIVADLALSRQPVAA
jgi:hypothetical protein